MKINTFLFDCQEGWSVDEAGYCVNNTLQISRYFCPPQHEPCTVMFERPRGFVKDRTLNFFRVAVPIDYHNFNIPYRLEMFKASQILFKELFSHDLLDVLPEDLIVMIKPYLNEQ